MKDLPFAVSSAILPIKWITLTLIMLHTFLLLLETQAQNSKTGQEFFLPNYYDDDTPDTNGKSKDEDTFFSISIPINGIISTLKQQCTKTKLLTHQKVEVLSAELMIKKVKEHFSKFQSSDRTIWDYGKVQCKTGQKWDRRLQKCIPVRRSPSHSSTGVTPKPKLLTKPPVQNPIAPNLNPESPLVSNTTSAFAEKNEILAASPVLVNESDSVKSIQAETHIAVASDIGSETLKGDDKKIARVLLEPAEVAENVQTADLESGSDVVSVTDIFNHNKNDTIQENVMKESANIFEKQEKSVITVEPENSQTEAETDTKSPAASDVDFTDHLQDPGSHLGGNISSTKPMTELQIQKTTNTTVGDAISMPNSLSKTLASSASTYCYQNPDELIILIFVTGIGICFDNILRTVA